MENFEDFLRSNQIINIFKIKQQQKCWMNIFQLVYDDKIDTWDYQWAYTCFINNGLCIMSNVNLVSNIGFSRDSLHTKDENSIFSKMEAREITKIIHPEFVLVDQEADFLTSKLCFGNINIFTRIKNKILRVARKIMGLL